MTRRKVKLAFISNDSARKATYKKRKKGLLKKMEELTTLCDVKACAVLYSPYESRPVVWPGLSGAREVAASFKRLPEMEKAKKMVSQEEFMRQRVAKANEQLKRLQKENREKEMTQVMYQSLTGKSLQNFSLLDLSDLEWVIDQHLNEINRRIEALKEGLSPLHDDDKNNPSKAPLCTALGEGLQGQRGHFDAMQVPVMMMMKQWSPFMEMMGPPQVHGHHYPDLHEMEMSPTMGIGGGTGSGMNGWNCGTNNMNMRMLMDYEIGDYHDLVVNPTLWNASYK